MHILLVDDDPQVLALYEVALQHAGYDVTTATNGADAIALVAMTHFDLVILDVAMPQKDGIQVLREMKQLKPACAAIMITAVFPYDEVRREQALNLGAFAYLMKPQTVAEFVAIVEKYVAHIDLAI